MTAPISPLTTEEIMEQRGEIYGSYTKICQIAESIETSLRSGESWPMLRPEQKQSLKMMAHKMARVVCGNTQYRDNWLDMSGYAELVVKEIDRRVEANIK